MGKKKYREKRENIGDIGELGNKLEAYRACSLDFEKRSILADSDLIVKSGISDSMISDQGHLMSICILSPPPKRL